MDVRNATRDGSSPATTRFERRAFVELSSIASVFLLGFLDGPAYATMPSDLCTGDPCVISGNVTVDPGSFLDFGAVDLRFASSAVVQVQSSYFKAKSITLEGGARLVGGGLNCDGVGLEATSGGIALLENAGVLSYLDLKGPCPGTADLITYPTGDVTVDGVIDVSAQGGDYASGGSIGISAAGAVLIHGKLVARSGTNGTGGFMGITGETAGVVVVGTLDVSSPVSGGVIELSAYGGDVSATGTFDIRGGFDSGGRLGILSDQGSASLGGTVAGTGSLGNGVYTCSGDPNIDITTAQDVTIGATIILNGLGQYCGSGFLGIEAGGSVTQLPGSKISASGLSGAAAGAVMIQAGGDVVLRDIDMKSSYGGGSLEVNTTGGAVQALGGINVSGPSGGAGIQGCDVFVASKASITSTQGGGIGLTASETMTVIGKLTSNGNLLYIREGAPFLAGTIAPAPVVTVVPGLPDCRPGPSCTPGGSCGDGIVQCGEECDDGAANGTIGSTCSTSCVETPAALRIPGGGSPPLDCPYEWSAALSPGGIVVAPNGIPKAKQSCQDNDPSCDFEPAPGVCKLHLWSCLGGADARINCSAMQVASTSVVAPKANAKPAELAARQALEAALVALGSPVGPGEECTPRYDVVVGVGQKALKFKTKATLSIGPVDSDSLELTCTP